MGGAGCPGRAGWHIDDVSGASAGMMIYMSVTLIHDTALNLLHVFIVHNEL
jgi:hypothetical protein